MWTPVSLCLLLCVVAHCLHEDEIGKRDWTKQNLGNPYLSILPSPNVPHRKKTAFFATDAPSLAAVSIRTGSILWRKHFSPADGVLSACLTSGAVVSTSSTKVHGWNPDTGLILWTSRVPTTSTFGSDDRVMPVGVFPTSYVEGESDSYAEGVTLVTFEYSVESTDAQVCLSTLHIVSWQIDSFTGAMTTNSVKQTVPVSLLSVPCVATGATIEPVYRDPMQSVLSWISAVVPGAVVFVDVVSHKFKLIELILSDKHSKTEIVDVTTVQQLSFPNAPQGHQFSLADVKLERFDVGQAMSQLVTASVTLPTGTSRVLMSVSNHKLYARPFPQSTCATAVGVSNDIHQVAQLTVTVQANHADLSVQETAEQTTTTYKLTDISLVEDGHVIACAGQLIPVKDGASRLVRMLVVTASGRVITVTSGGRDGNSRWMRDEAQSMIKYGHFVELHKPELGDDDLYNGGLNPIIVVKRLVVQFEDLKQFLHRLVTVTVPTVVKSVQNKISNQADEVVVRAPVVSVLTQDKFGFRKLIVLVSGPQITRPGSSVQAGSIFAVHTESAEVIWRRYMLWPVAELLQKRDTRLAASSLADLTQRLEISVRNVFLGDVTEQHHHAGQYVLWITATVHSSTAWTSCHALPAGLCKHQVSEHNLLIHLNPLSGDIRDAGVWLDTKVKHVMMLPFTYAHDKYHSIHPLVIIHINGEVSIYPDDHAASNIVREHSKQSTVLLYDVDYDNHEIKGYSLVVEFLTKEIRTTPSTWKVAFDAAHGESVVKVVPATTDISRRNLLTSDGIKLWTANNSDPTATDKEMRYKYLNPNTLVVVTSRSIPSTDSNEATVPTITLYLVDAVTGSVLTSMQHTHAAPPVTVAIVENYVVYHFLNSKKMRFRVGLWQLFDHTSATGVMSSANMAMILQSFFRTPPPKFSSYGSGAPQVAARGLVFPTPVVAMTPSVSPKGIMPKLLFIGTSYGQVLSTDLRWFESDKITTLTIMPTSWLTYNQTLHGLHSVITAHTVLESSCHVLAIGLDLFYARSTPSAPFDLLGEDFSYGFLLFTVVFLVVATIVTKKAVSRSDLTRAWA